MASSVTIRRCSGPLYFDPEIARRAGLAASTNQVLTPALAAAEAAEGED